MAIVVSISTSVKPRAAVRRGELVVMSFLLVYVLGAILEAFVLRDGGCAA